MKKRFGLFAGVVLVLAFSAFAFSGCESLFFGTISGPKPVVPPTLTRIEIVADPSFSNYEEGDTFLTDGMEVEAFYSDGTSKSVTDYTISPDRPLTVSDTEITVYYGGMSDTIAISVVAKQGGGDTRTLTRIEIVTDPQRFQYYEGETFSEDGMVAEAFYSDATSGPIAGYTISPDRPLTVSDTEITVSYGGMSDTVAIYVGIRPDPASYSSSVFDSAMCSFYDDFDGDALDLQKWSHQTGNGQYDPITEESGNWAWGNNELEYYQAENTTVSDGTMKITAQKEDTEKDGMWYTSSRIRTKGKFSQKYGRIEAKIKLPAGTGLWPAFWMLPEDEVYGGWPRSGEIDIMEARGREPDRVDHTLHFGSNWPDNRYSGTSYTLPDGGRIDEWHVYAIEWSEGKVKWLVDNIVTHEISQSEWYTDGADKETDPNAPFDEEFHIIFNLAVGGNYDGNKTPDDGFTSAVMEVDFVRVYTLENNPW
jgi:beta-glucanase (GH16 family)